MCRNHVKHLGPSVSAFNTCSCQTLVLTSFILLKWLNRIHPIHYMSLRSAPDSPVKVTYKITLFFHLSSLHLRIHFDVVNNSAQGYSSEHHLLTYLWKTFSQWATSLSLSRFAHFQLFKNTCAIRSRSAGFVTDWSRHLDQNSEHREISSNRTPLFGVVKGAILSI